MPAKKGKRVTKKQQTEWPTKWNLIGTAVIIVLFIVEAILIWQPWRKPEVTQTDAERFATEYTQVEKENPFVYRDAEEVIKILEHGTGVVFLGFPECQWCQAYVKYVAEVARDKGMDTIYYYNIAADRRDNTAEYQKIVEILDEHLQYDDEGNRRIYVPNITFVIEGEIIGNDWESSKDTLGYENATDYWTEERVGALKVRLADWMQKIVDTKGCVTTCNE